MSDMNDMESGSQIPFPMPAHVIAELGAISTPSSDMDGDSSLISTSSKTPKKRTTSDAKIDSDDDEQNVTPKKTKGTPAKGTPKSTPKSGKQGKRKANKNPTAALPMGRSYEMCGEYDKMLVDWKDAGRSWPDIRNEWHRITGNKVATSTLPNRYSRLKDNFVVIKEEDNPTLIEAKQQIEADFEKEKWSLISKAMVERGTEEYRPDALNRQYKKLMQMAVDLEADEKKPKGQRPNRNVNDYEVNGDGAGDGGELV